MAATKEEIFTLKKLNKNKQIIWADNNLKNLLRKIINKSLSSYKGLPLTWEDIYYEFLYHIPEIIRVFKKETNVKFETYIGLRCKWFTLNKCKIFSSNKHKVLNQYINIESPNVYSKLKDPKKQTFQLDISSLSNMELQMYNDFFLDGLKVAKIMKKRKLSRYKVNNLITNVKLKLMTQIKN